MARNIASAAVATRSTAPSDGPGPASLTQVPSKGAARCPECGGTRLTRITMVLTDGSPVDFTSCHNCEHRTWAQQGSALPIDTVLDKTRKPR
jgi:hypothetical protein